MSLIYSVFKSNVLFPVNEKQTGTFYMIEEPGTLKKLFPFTQLALFFPFCLCFCAGFQVNFFIASKRFSHFLRNTKTGGVLCCLAQTDRKHRNGAVLTL